MKLSFVLLWVMFSCAIVKGTDSPPQGPAVFILNADVLRANKARIASKDASLMPAYKQLLKDADKALEQGPFSVMEKKHLPPSGDKHDYMSLAPYHWPDPTKPGGLPYMRKDGQTNPEVKEYKDKEYQPKMCELVNTLALAYLVDLVCDFVNEKCSGAINPIAFPSVPFVFKLEFGCKAKWYDGSD